MARRTLAATPAAAAEHAERALDVCLQQPAFRQADGCVAITLLRVSKRLAALVAARCGGGTLAARTTVKTPAQADALAAWLTNHGALLAELELELRTGGPAWQAAAAEAQRGQQQHPAARALQELPGSLRRLVFDRSGLGDVEAAKAAALAAAFSRQPMQLRHLALPRSWANQAVTLLPALRQLGQLTNLVMSAWYLGQLPAQHLPAQLQQLELCVSGRFPAAALPWLALPHLTGLTSLSVPVMCVDGGVLPRCLHALTVADVSTAVPLQRLAQLTALQLTRCAASAEQLRQLSALQRLEQLSVTMVQSCTNSGFLSNAAAGLGPLPLVHLSARFQELTAACLDHLGACTRLTQLQLYSCRLAPGATLEQLAAMLGRLTALERFEDQIMILQPVAGDADWSPMCQALARLPRLAACNLSCANLGPAAVTQLAAATQLMELHVAQCGLDDASVLALCSGLTGLRRLDVSCNYALGDGCLEGIAALRQLSWLDVSRTGVTEAGLQQLQAARPKVATAVTHAKEWAA